MALKDGPQRNYTRFEMSGVTMKYKVYIPTNTHPELYHIMLDTGSI